MHNDLMTGNFAELPVWVPLGIKQLVQGLLQVDERKRLTCNYAIELLRESIPPKYLSRQLSDSSDEEEEKQPASLLPLKRQGRESMSQVECEPAFLEPYPKKSAMKLRQEKLESDIERLSKITNLKEQRAYLTKALPDDATELELIYRATQHGFRANSFHDKCDGVGRTLTIF